MIEERTQSHEEARADAACIEAGHTLFTTRPGCQTCVKREALRLKRNASARARTQALRDLGLVKTPYGWE